MQRDTHFALDIFKCIFLELGKQSCCKFLKIMSGTYWQQSMPLSRTIVAMNRWQAITWMYWLKPGSQIFSSFEIQTYLPRIIVRKNPFRTICAWAVGTEVSRYLGNNRVMSSLLIDRQLNKRITAYRIPYFRMLIRYKGIPWQRQGSGFLKECPRAEASLILFEFIFIWIRFHSQKLNIQKCAT